MSVKTLLDPSVPAEITADPAQAPWVSIGEQFHTVERSLEELGQLGILTITVLQRESRCVENGWSEYDATLAAISEFLPAYLQRRMRSTDLLLDPVAAGNTFVVFVAPPRNARALDWVDLARVRLRLTRSIRRHLSDTLTRSALDKFGVYVGGTLMRHDPNVNGRHAICRCVDTAFANSMEQRRVEKRTHSAQLKRVLHRGELRTVYQPVVQLHERRVLGYEALTRVSPEQFATPDLLFKAAQQHGALWELERLSRRRALNNLPALRPGELLFLNVELGSISDPDLTSPEFLAAVERSGVQPSQIVLELTEHAALSDYPAAREQLERHRAAGYRIALDDVGSGYAGLHAIVELGPDFLKIDMALVRDLHLNPIKRELIRTIRDFTERTGSTLVAEGVEQLPELESLLDAGVCCAQGYLLGKPAAAPQPPIWSFLDAASGVA